MRKQGRAGSTRSSFPKSRLHNIGHNALRSVSWDAKRPAVKCMHLSYLATRSQHGLFSYQFHTRSVAHWWCTTCNSNHAHHGSSGSCLLQLAAKYGNSHRRDRRAFPNVSKPATACAKAPHCCSKGRPVQREASCDFSCLAASLPLKPGSILVQSSCCCILQQHTTPPDLPTHSCIL